MKIDVIIPTYNPDENLTLLLGNLKRQTIAPYKIFILNTVESGFDTEQFDALYKQEENIEIRHISCEDFDHGTTRNEGAWLSDADYILFITQDALPTDNHLIENLANSLNDNVVSAFARQVASENLPIEHLSRTFNYPTVSYVKSEKDKNTLGIKVIFCSNVCAMYDREVFKKLNGFPTQNIFNEDMLYAYKVIKSGYSIAYVADAIVSHTHCYSIKKIFQRYFDQGVSQKQNEAIFKEFSTMKEGSKQATFIIKSLAKKGKIGDIALFVAQSIAKLSGLFLGKHYKVLPESMRIKMSMNKHYWEKLKRNNKE